VIVMAKREHNHAGTLALIAGGGALAWLLLHGGGGGGGDGPASAAPPPAAPCRLRLDARALTIDGHDTTTDDAIVSCRASGHAEVVITGDAIAGVADQLLAALARAGIAVSIKNPTHRGSP
jgi:hypothetical protein